MVGMGRMVEVTRGRMGLGHVDTMFATSNKCIATSNKCLTTSKKKLVVTRSC